MEKLELLLESGRSGEGLLTPDHIYNMFSNILGVEDDKLDIKLGSKYNVGKGDSSFDVYNTYSMFAKLNKLELPDIELLKDEDYDMGVVIVVKQTVSKHQTYVSVGGENHYCHNWMTFGEHFRQDITNNQDDVNNALMQSKKILEEKQKEFVNIIQKMKSKTYDESGFNEQLAVVGRRMFKSKQQRLFPYLQHAMSLVDNKEHLGGYYYDMPHSDYKILNLMNDKLKDKPLLNSFSDAKPLQELILA